MASSFGLCVFNNDLAKSPEMPSSVIPAPPEAGKPRIGVRGGPPESILLKGQANTWPPSGPEPGSLGGDDSLLDRPHCL